MIGGLYFVLGGIPAISWTPTLASFILVIGVAVVSTGGLAVGVGTVIFTILTFALLGVLTGCFVTGS